MTSSVMAVVEEGWRKPMLGVHGAACVLVCKLSACLSVLHVRNTCWLFSRLSLCVSKTQNLAAISARRLLEAGSC